MLQQDQLLVEFLLELFQKEVKQDYLIMDFTIKKYKELLSKLEDSRYSFQTFEQFIQNPKKKAIVLRHDVDLLPDNSLRFAKIQDELGINGSYYFRAVPESWDEIIIKEIAVWGN